MPGIARYAYDDNGKRIRTLKANGEIEYTLYTFSGSMASYSRPGSGLHSNYVQVDGKTVAEVTNGNTTYLHPDLLGSPRLATNGSQQQLWREHYGPYGEKLNSVGTKTGYTGHAYDGETGLTYAQARFYDPVIGRFLSIDPIAFTNSPFTFNRYGYGNNNPYAFIDPTGEATAPATEIQPPRLAPNLSSRLGGSSAAGIYAAARMTPPGRVATALIAAGALLAAVVESGTEPDSSSQNGDKGTAPAEPDANSGSRIDPADSSGELTVAGRAQQKHGDRAGSAFDRATGSPESKNAQGQATLDAIMNSPGRNSDRNHRGGTDVRETLGGRGARFDENGKFTAFIEPKR